MGEGKAGTSLPDFLMVAVECGFQGPENPQCLLVVTVKRVPLEAHLSQTL